MDKYELHRSFAIYKYHTSLSLLIKAHILSFFSNKKQETLF